MKGDKMDHFKEVRSVSSPFKRSYSDVLCWFTGAKPFKRAYLAVMLWFMGRAVQASARVDEDIKREVADLPENFSFSLGVAPAGPAMVMGKDKNGRLKYLGWKTEGKEIDVVMKIKNIEAAILLFTFQEGTAVSNSRDRLIVDGDVPPACAVVRILDIVEVYLLPKFIAKLAVKRYPSWSPVRKFIGRTRIYFRTILGY